MLSCLVSVIIPVYNGVNSGVKSCLKSVMEQDINDMEIIIINDCSSDNTEEIINSMLKFSSVRYTIKKHDYNCGLTKSLNEGMGLSQGTYILIIQQDCSLTYKSSIKDSINFMEENKIKVLIGTPNVDFKILTDYQKLFKVRLSESSNNENEEKKPYLTQLKCDLFKSEIFTTIGPFVSIGKSFGQDFVLSSKLLKNSIEMRTLDTFNFIIKYEGKKISKHMLKRV